MRISGGLVTSAATLGLLVAACNGSIIAIGPSSTEDPAPAAEAVKGTVSSKPAVPHTVGGTVAGLSGRGLTLQLNGGDELVVGENGRFTFPAKLAKGAAFGVTVKTQPTGPSQLCVLGGDTGTMGDADVRSVTVDCFTDKYVVGGTAQGVAGTGVVLQLNGGNDVHVSANGKWAFPAPLASQALYGVTVKSKPTNPSQTCTVTNGLGMVPDGGVSNILVVCRTDTYALSGTVTGLAGKGLVLHDEGLHEDLPVAADGTFTFKKRVVSKGSFDVSVKTQPSDVTQSCTVSGASGSNVDGDISTVAVNCSTKLFAVETTSSNANGATLVFNGKDVLIEAEAAISLGTLPSGTLYKAELKEKPTNPSRTCVVTNGEGKVTDGPRSDMFVSCTTDTFTVSGTVSGATAGLALVNQLEDPDYLSLPGNGSFTFVTKVASGAEYDVGVKVNPPGQTCTVGGPASATMGNADVTGVTVTCEDDAFAVGGTVSGLAGTVVLDNGGEKATIAQDGSFTFATKVARGAAYSVTIDTQPGDQTCAVSNGSGTIAASAISNVTVSCRTTKHAVGGTVTGLAAGDSITLANRATGEQIVVSANTSFAFTTKVEESSTYEVYPSREPSTNGYCKVTNGAATMGTSDVSNLVVVCSPIPGYAGFLRFANNNRSSGNVGNRFWGLPITVGSTTTVNTIGFVSRGNTGHARFGLYSGTSSQPSSLIAQTGELALGMGRIEGAITPTTIAAGTYWIIANSDSGFGVAMSDAPTASIGFAYGPGSTYASSMPGSISGFSGGSETPWSFYLLTQ